MVCYCVRPPILAERILTIVLPWPYMLQLKLCLGIFLSLVHMKGSLWASYTMSHATPPCIHA